MNEDVAECTSPPGKAVIIEKVGDGHRSTSTDIAFPKNFENFALETSKKITYLRTLVLDLVYQLLFSL